MFAPVALALALAAPSAPVPKAAPPAGPPPYILHLKGNDDDGGGKANLRIVRTEPQKVTVATVVQGPNGPVVQQVEREVTVSKVVLVGVEDLKDLKAYTADGKDLTPKQAAEKIGGGAIVVASADGAKIHEAYLKLFRDDVIILCSPDLVPQAGPSVTTLPRALVRPAVMPAVPVMPAMPAPLPAAPVPPPVVPLPPPAAPETK